MSEDFDQRKIRELKRAVKKRGNKHRRQQSKKILAVDPAHAAEHEDDFGRHRSAGLNGYDHDNTRKSQKADDQDTRPTSAM